MINLSYDPTHNTVIIDFIGKIDPAQSEDYLASIPKLVPKDKKKFNLLVDLSLVESMDPHMKGPIKQAMEIFNSHGVEMIIRVIPNPHHDIGLNIMSFFHYDKKVRMLTLKSRQEANDRLRKSAKTHLK